MIGQQIHHYKILDKLGAALARFHLECQTSIKA